MISIIKLLVLILCALLQFHTYNISTFAISIMLIAFIVSMLPLIIKNDIFGQKGLRIITGICLMLYLLIALFVPALRCYIPLLLMDAFCYKLIIPIILGLLGSLLELNDDIGVFTLFLSMLAIICQYVINKNITLSEELKKLRDTSKERELLVEEKNRRLIEKQDSELYTATLKERNRIAREIHDNVGHMLTRSILQVGAIKTINKDTTLAEPLEGLHDTLNTAMSNIRKSVHDLHDESIDLKMAILEIIENIDSPTVTFNYDMSSSIPKSIKYCFITITKEAVNNVIKHSNASSLIINVQEHPGFYQLLIHDNGTNIKTNVSDGIGLTNMRDRVKGLGGNIKISTDHGFSILISIIKTGDLE